MLVVPLLALALSLPPTDLPSHMELGATVRLTYFDISYPPSMTTPAASGADSIQGGGALAATMYLGDGVVDDDSPLTLQPFLQRRSAASLSGGGSGFDLWARWWDRHGAAGNVGLAIGGYPQRNVYLTASFGARYQTWRDSDWTGAPYPDKTVWDLPASVGAGVRVHDVLVMAGWSVDPTRGTNSTKFSVPFWGGAYVSGRAVLNRRTDLDASVAVANKGARASLGVERFFGRRLGVWLSLAGGHAHDTDGNAPLDTLGGTVGVAYWFTRQVRGTCSYSPEWLRSGEPDAYSHVSHGVSFGLTARF
jgi:hypothetical protein